MNLRRNIIDKLSAWTKKKNRKPLLLMGARQVGKTTLLKHFANTKYKNNYLYLNFEKQIELHQIFKKSKDPKKIIESLGYLHKSEIEESKTLLIFDEIQECRAALTALKYFQEEAPKYLIIAAGSLLGITLGHSNSFPVGKVEFLDLFPLTFSEYLAAVSPNDFKALKHFCSLDVIEPIPELFFNKFEAHFKNYMICGGMPEAATTFIDTQDFSQVNNIHEQIIRAYQLDFAKHTSSAISTKIQYVWQSLPSQLARENKKFLYSAIRSGARARAYEEAIVWLAQAGLVNAVHRTSKPGLPLHSYKDLSAFKLYILDVGLLCHLAKLNPQNYILGNHLFTEFKGAFTENYVAQSIAAKRVEPFYWTSDGVAEIDFLIQKNDSIFPLEVKAGKSSKSKSLKVFIEKYKPNLSVGLSLKNLEKKENYLQLPLFCLDFLLPFLEQQNFKPS